MKLALDAKTIRLETEHNPFTGETVELSLDPELVDGVDSVSTEIAGRVFAALDESISRARKQIKSLFSSIAGSGQGHLMAGLVEDFDRLIARFRASGKMKITYSEESASIAIEIPEELRVFLEGIEAVREFSKSIYGIKAELDSNVQKQGGKASQQAGIVASLREISAASRTHQQNIDLERAESALDRYQKRGNAASKRVSQLQEQVADLINSSDSFDSFQEAAASLLANLKGSGLITASDAKRVEEMIKNPNSLEEVVLSADVPMKTKYVEKENPTARPQRPGNRAKLIGGGVAFVAAAVVIAMFAGRKSPTPQILRGSSYGVRAPYSAGVEPTPRTDEKVKAEYIENLGNGSEEAAMRKLQAMNRDGLKQMLKFTDKPTGVGDIFPATIRNEADLKEDLTPQQKYDRAYARNTVLRVHEEITPQGTVRKVAEFQVQFTGVPEWNTVETIEVETDGIPPYLR